MILRNDNKFKNILNYASIRYADGIGIVWALKKKKVKSVRIPGCDFWLAIMKEASINKTATYLLGGKSETLNETVTKLELEHNINIVGSHDGYFFDDDQIINDIIASKAKIITVALGSPKQEIFIHKCSQKYPYAFYMGVGGTYDVYVGKIKRAPVWAQKNQVEWLYRLIKQPTRIFRQTKLLAFLFLLLINKL